MNRAHSLTLLVLIAAPLAAAPIAYYSITIPDDKMLEIANYANEERKKTADLVFNSKPSPDNNKPPYDNNAFYHVDQVIAKVLDFFKEKDLKQYAEIAIPEIRQNAENFSKQAQAYNAQMADAIAAIEKIVIEFKSIKRLLFEDTNFLYYDEKSKIKVMKYDIADFEAHIPKLKQMQEFYRSEKHKDYYKDWPPETQPRKGDDYANLNIVEEELYIPEYKEGQEHLGYSGSKYTGNYRLCRMRNVIKSLQSVRKTIKQNLEVAQKNMRMAKWWLNSNISTANDILKVLSVICEPLDRFNELEEKQIKWRKDHRQFVVGFNKKLPQDLATTYNSLLEGLAVDNTNIRNIVTEFRQTRRANDRSFIIHYDSKNLIKLLENFSNGLGECISKEFSSWMLLKKQVVRLARNAFFNSVGNWYIQSVFIDKIAIKVNKESDKQLVIENQRCIIYKLYVDPESDSVLPPSDVPLYEDAPYQHERKRSLFTKEEMSADNWNTEFTSWTSDSFVNLVNNHGTNKVRITDQTCTLYLLGKGNIRLDLTFEESVDLKHHLKAELLDGKHLYII